MYIEYSALHIPVKQQEGKKKKKRNGRKERTLFDFTM
jgi:hypothetical protein